MCGEAPRHLIYALRSCQARRRRRLWWPSSLRPNPGNRDTLNSWDCRRTLKRMRLARRTCTVSFLSSAALWIWLLKINKNDARSAAFSVPSTSRFFSAGSLIPGAKFNACESGRRMGTRVAGAGAAWEFQRASSRRQLHHVPAQIETLLAAAARPDTLSCANLNYLL